MNTCIPLFRNPVQRRIPPFPCTSSFSSNYNLEPPTETMAVTAITSLKTFAPVDDAVQKLDKALKAINTPAHFVIGTNVQNSGGFQVTSEWTHVQSPSELEASTAFISFLDTMSSLDELSSSPVTTLATLDHSPFVDDIDPLIEYVTANFPAALVTPMFQTHIEADAARFEEIFRKRGDPQSVGEGKLAIGWSPEWASVSEEKIRSFVLLRGWATMEDFDKSCQTEEFREAVPILMGWNRQFEVVSISAYVGTD
jgi:hypothetical protein